jgi:hypothetical protein
MGRTCADPVFTANITFVHPTGKVGTVDVVDPHVIRIKSPSKCAGIVTR